MKSVRIWFKKQDECIYISHLDLNRCVLRALHKSRLPVWHTEGFNPHPFVTFSLPLSLGFKGENESMDVRLIDDDFPLSSIPEMLNPCLPMGIRVFKATEPVIKPGKIAYARFKMLCSGKNTSPQKMCEVLKNLFSEEQLIVEKKSKKGVKEIDIKPYFIDYSLNPQIGGAELNITLPAGSTNNVNPSLVTDAVKKYRGIDVDCCVTRLYLMNDKFQVFE